MHRTPAALVFSFMLVTSGQAGEAQIEEALGYNLSMAGALINDKCERSWESAGYISIHACNYQFSQFYNMEIATAHFVECATASGGDIVKIADCMVARFNAWVAAEQLE